MKMRWKKQQMTHNLFFCVAIIQICSFLLLTGCGNKQKQQVPEFYKNLYTGEIMPASEYETFSNKLASHYFDSLNEHVHIQYRIYNRKNSPDSIINSFKYNIKVGNKYIVRAEVYEKIGMTVSPKTLQSISGNNISVGGIQDKPTMINLWFISCPGCVAEIPALNILQERYADKMNFIALTFEDKKAVKKFLLRKPFNFIHVADADDMINYIGTNPYPESIFIDRHGCIRYIESVISGDEAGVKQFESIIEELLADNGSGEIP
jgi:thiol-disulfide isomerase/thioredoxin